MLEGKILQFINKNIQIHNFYQNKLNNNNTYLYIQYCNFKELFQNYEITTKLIWMFGGLIHPGPDYRTGQLGHSLGLSADIGAKIQKI